MMNHQPLFSTYRAGENRVTSSMLAVFQRIDLALVERLLAAASGESSLGLVTFSNQIVESDGESVPDGGIYGNFRYLFEVKTARNAVNLDQLTKHLRLLDRSHADERLFLITPDPVSPKALGAVGDQRLTWFNFAALSDAIDDLIADPLELIGDRTAFLLRELQHLLRVGGLLEFNDVVIVAGRRAYPEYAEISAYVCQPMRAFVDGLTHLGFYAQSAIQPEIAKIEYREDEVVFSGKEAERRLVSGDPFQERVGHIIGELLASESRVEEAAYQVFLLSGPNDVGTVRLGDPIINDKTTKSGKTWAWTLGQRYTRLAYLQQNPATTSELDALEGSM